MRRRALIAMLGGAALAGPLAARAEAAGPLRRGETAVWRIVAGFVFCGLSLGSPASAAPASTLTDWGYATFTNACGVGAALFDIWTNSAPEIAAGGHPTRFIVATPGATAKFKAPLYRGAVYDGACPDDPGHGTTQRYIILEPGTNS